MRQTGGMGGIEGYQKNVSWTGGNTIRNEVEIPELFAYKIIVPV